MKTNYQNLINYYEQNNDENYFDKHIESIKNDEYNEQVVGEIYDALNDEEMLSDFETGLILDMFKYYVKHGEDYYETLSEEYK